MAVPKKKNSRSRRDSRRAEAWRARTRHAGKCSNCGADNLPFQICQSCGHYKGRKVIVSLPEKRNARQEKQKAKRQQAAA